MIDLIESFREGVYVYRAEQGLQPWRKLWHWWAGISFLRGYLETAQGSLFLPETPEELRNLLDAYLLEKALYELAYELNNRPDWVDIPMQGILEISDPSDFDISP